MSTLYVCSAYSVNSDMTLPMLLKNVDFYSLWECCTRDTRHKIHKSCCCFSLSQLLVMSRPQRSLLKWVIRGPETKSCYKFLFRVENEPWAKPGTGRGHAFPCTSVKQHSSPDVVASEWYLLVRQCFSLVNTDETSLGHDDVQPYS